MIRAALAAALLLPLAGPALSQTEGPCREGYRWSGGEGVARYAACADDTPLLTLTCTRGAPIEGRIAADTGGIGAGRTATGRFSADGQIATLLYTPAEEGDALVFDMPEPALAAMARGSVARISAAGGTSTLHLSGSSAAIAAMRRTCRAAAPEEDETAAPGVQFPLTGDLAAGTAPAEDVIAAFRAAREGRPSEEVPEDADAPRRCDALGAAGLSRVDAEEMARICRDAVAAAPDTPRHAFDAARALLATGAPEDAMPLLRQAAEAGHPAAMNALAIAILSGRTEARPGEDSGALLAAAAEAGHPPALANLAEASAVAGLLADYPSARDLAVAAARAGDPVAATLLGAMARDGRGMPPDANLARRWLRVGAARGDADALLALADLDGGGADGQAYRDAAIAAGHRAAVLNAAIADGADGTRLSGAAAQDPLRRGWDDGLRYLDGGRDSDGALFRLSLGAGEAGGAIRDALRGRRGCEDGALYLVSPDRLACTAP